MAKKNGSWDLTDVNKFKRAGAHLGKDDFASKQLEKVITVDKKLNRLCVLNLSHNDATMVNGLHLLWDMLVRYDIAEENRKIDNVEISLAGWPNRSRNTRSAWQNRLAQARKYWTDDNYPIPVFVIVVLASKDAESYAEVKRWGDCEVGIPTFCITHPKSRNITKTVLANIW